MWAQAIITAEAHRQYTIFAASLTFHVCLPSLLFFFYRSLAHLRERVKQVIAQPRDVVAIFAQSRDVLRVVSCA